MPSTVITDNYIIYNDLVNYLCPFMIITIKQPTTVVIK